VDTTSSLCDLLTVLHPQVTAQELRYLDWHDFMQSGTLQFCWLGCFEQHLLAFAGEQLRAARW